MTNQPIRERLLASTFIAGALVLVGAASAFAQSSAPGAASNPNSPVPTAPAANGAITTNTPQPTNAPATASQTFLAGSDTPSSTGGASKVQEIVVTGSSIRRRNIETASPVQLITEAQIKQSGYTTISQVLQDVPANGAGTLSSNNSEAFAGGASGIALRGLSVGDTLTLVDGHRLAPYPLSDDGERQFVDVQSIPFDAIERVEILKDGASSIYGSDAIAGVVNIILKKSLTGFNATAEAGTTQHGGGDQQHFAFSAGKGDLGGDGYNAYIDVEFRHEDPITLSQRSYQDWATLDFSGLGGNNLTPGAPNIFNSGAAPTLTPYLVNPNGSFSNPNTYAFLAQGCNYAALMGNKCSYASPQVLQQPTQNVNVLGSFTKDFGQHWELDLKLSLFDSQGQQTGGGYSTYPGAAYSGQISNPIGGFPQLNVGSESYLLPANYPGNTTGGQAYLIGAIPQVGLSQIKFDSKTSRFAADLSGKLLGWDVSADGGASYVNTHVTYDGFVNYQNLYTDLLSGAFNPVGANSKAILANVAPQFFSNATDTLAYLELHATRALVNLPNFTLAAAAGFNEIYKNLDNPGAAPVLAGTVGGPSPPTPSAVRTTSPAMANSMRPSSSRSN